MEDPLVIGDERVARQYGQIIRARSLLFQAALLLTDAKEALAETMREEADTAARQGLDELLTQMQAVDRAVGELAKTLVPALGGQEPR